jgi:hypothetical protein
MADNESLMHELADWRWAPEMETWTPCFCWLPGKNDILPKIGQWTNVGEFRANHLPILAARHIQRLG